MKKTLAVSLVAAMALSAAFPAAAANTPIEIPNDVKTAHIVCAVPMKTNFAVDAFQKEETSGQIWSPSYAFINKSDVALRLSIKPKVEVLNSASLADAPSGVPKAGDKKAYMELVPATSATVKTTQEGAIVSDTLKKPKLSVETKVAAASGTAGVADTTAGTITFANYTATATAPIPDLGSTFDLVLYNGNAEIGRVQSAETVASFDGAALSIVKLFDGKEIAVPAKPDTTGSENVVCTINGTAVAIKFTDKAGNTTGAATTNWNTTASTNIKYAIVPHAGKAAEGVVNTDEGSAPVYAAYDSATGAATGGKVALAAAESETKKLTYALGKATYSKEYADSKEPDLVTAINPDFGVAAFRVMGTVTPAPTTPWAANDLKLVLSYDFGGMPAQDYSGKRDARSGERNLISSAAEPVLASSNSLTAIKVTGGTAPTTKHTINFTNGTLESLIASDTAYTIGVKRATASNDTLVMLDNATVAPMTVNTTSSSSTVKIEVNCAEAYNAGAYVNDDCVYVVTFTATDDYVTTLTTPSFNVSGIA